MQRTRSRKHGVMVCTREPVGEASGSACQLTPDIPQAWRHRSPSLSASPSNNSNNALIDLRVDKKKWLIFFLSFDYFRVPERAVNPISFFEKYFLFEIGMSGTVHV